MNMEALKEGEDTVARAKKTLGLMDDILEEIKT